MVKLMMISMLGVSMYSMFSEFVHASNFASGRSHIYMYATVLTLFSIKNCLNLPSYLTISSIKEHLHDLFSHYITLLYCPYILNMSIDAALYQVA